MKALRLAAPKQPEIVHIGQPVCTSGQALIKVLACGLCGSDLNAWRGVQGVAFPMAPGEPGREVWGEIAALGESHQHFAVGQKVTGLVKAGFAEYALAELHELAPLGRFHGNHVTLGEPLACAANVVRRARVRAGDSLAIVGFGYLAALIVQLLDHRPERWIALARREDNLRLARELGGEAFAYDAVPGDAWDSFDVVIEAAGVQQTLDYATWLTTYAGRLVIAGYHADGPRTVNMQSWNWKGIDVVNAHERDPDVCMRGLGDGLRAVEERGLKLDRLLTHSWPLAGAGEAFAAAENHPAGYVKGVVRPWA